MAAAPGAAHRRWSCSGWLARVGITTRNPPSGYRVCWARLGSGGSRRRRVVAIPKDTRGLGVRYECDGWGWLRSGGTHNRGGRHVEQRAVPVLRTRASFFSLLQPGSGRIRWVAWRTGEDAVRSSMDRGPQIRPSQPLFPLEPHKLCWSLSTTRAKANLKLEKQFRARENASAHPVRPIAIIPICFVTWPSSTD